MLKMIPTLVVYHENCNDGLCAAAVVLLAAHYVGQIARVQLNEEMFVPHNYGRPLPEAVLAGGKGLLFVDFCPEEDQIQQFADKWEMWQVIDHHESRAWIKDRYPGNCIFDTSKSAAKLAWEHYFPDGEENQLVNYVEDRDLWKWELPDSKKVNAGLSTIARNVKTWSYYLDDCFDWYSSNSSNFADWLRRPNANQIIEDFRERGESLLLAYANDRAQSLKNSWAIPGLAICNSSNQRSELAHELMEKHGTKAALVWWMTADYKVQMSFRSRPGTEHALNFAKICGGGGHAQAAGARVELSEFIMNLKLWVAASKDPFGFPAQ